MSDSPAEYKNQAYFQPFCCRIFEVDPSGVIAFIERVNPISSLEEFISVKDDIFNMMVTKIIGKYIVDDLGTKAFMNFGIRMNANGTAFGPVIIDFPYAYELDGAKLKCAHKVINKYTGQLEECGGDIDYGPGFNRLYCNKCNREYRAMDLAKENNTEVRFEYTDEDKAFAKRIRYKLRARIIDNGKVVIDSGRSSNRIISKEELEDMNNTQIPLGTIEVAKTYKKRSQNIQQTRQQYYTDLQVQYYNELAKKGVFNPAIKQPEPQEVDVVRKANDYTHAYGTTTSELMYDEYRKPESAKTLEVWKVINPDNSESIMGEVGILEDQVFPELKNAKEEPVKEESPEAEPTKIDLDSVEVDDHSVVSEPTYGQIVSDEEVQKMVDAVKIANDDESAKEMTSTIVDPEADKVPERSPFTRAYADPRNSVHYNPIKDEINGQPVNFGPVSETKEEEEDTANYDIMTAITEGIVEASKTPYESNVDEDYEDEYDEKPNKDKYREKSKRNKKHKKLRPSDDYNHIEEY